MNIFNFLCLLFSIMCFKYHIKFYACRLTNITFGEEYNVYGWRWFNWKRFACCGSSRAARVLVFNDVVVGEYHSVCLCMYVGGKFNAQIYA